MAKKVLKIEAFECGINQKYDPRDINDNQLEEAFNVDVSNPGRITMTGDGAAEYSHLTVKGNYVTPDSDSEDLLNGMNLTRGYGLFSFSHDYNMKGLLANETDNPDEVEVDFLCINDGADIHIWDSCHNPTPTGINDVWISKAITLGKAHANGAGDEFVEKVKPVYYKADNGLRACDGQFCKQDTGANATITSATATSITPLASALHGLSNNEYIKINNEILKVTDAETSSTTFVAIRGQFGTTPATHTNSSIYKINVPKVLSHIKRRFLEKAREYTDSTTYTNTAASQTINKWQEDVQCLEPANDYSTSGQSYGLVVYDGKVTGMSTSGTSGTTTDEVLQEPDAPEKVLFSIHESNSAEDKLIPCDTYADGGVVNSVNTIKITADSDYNFPGEGFTIGKFVIVKDSGSPGIDGLAEIVGYGASFNILVISGEYPAANAVPPV